MTKNAAVVLVGIIVIIAGVSFFSPLLRQTLNRGGLLPTAANPFSTDTSGLPEAKASEPVQLNHGDTFNLTASIVQKTIQGTPIKMLAYNGMIPGPTVKVPQNAQITIHFTNNTDTPTTIHSHGIRLDNAFDGVPDMTQPAIPVGGSFDYTLKFPDAGAFWYHPHVREDYAQALGLYGNFIVEPTDTAYWSAVNQEIPLMVGDILLNTDGSIVPFDQRDIDHALMGRYGNVLLLNGSTDYRIQARSNEVIRFAITNVATVRPFNIAISNAKMKIVGGDNGKYERETFADTVVLGPSERAVVEVLFEKPGTYVVQNKTPQKTYSLGTITVASQQATPSLVSLFNTLRTNQDIVRAIDPLRPLFAKAADKNLTLAVDMHGMGNMNMGASNGTTRMMSNTETGGHVMPDGSMMGGQMMMGSGDSIEWEDTMMNMPAEAVQWKIIDQNTNKENGDIHWNFKVGDMVKVKIFNNPHSPHPMQHPIHFHGQRFLVLSKNGVAAPNLVWKDTVLIGSGETVELLIEMKNPGDWMAHCHIPEHMENGMMFTFTVTP